ncbi:MAG: extracellular solute-binding protein [Holosporales bacterium]|nr:extracellular solute-binding protein [Holosporales bacterium]
MLKKVLAILACLAVCVYIFVGVSKKISHNECVNVYDWYGVLPREVIEQFQEETGIKVHYDVFDNNEILEAKLLASNSGYDVVFPTATPYAARHKELGIYQRLDKTQLPNLKFDDIYDFLKEKMQKIDPGLDFLLPLYWGTTGIAFNEDVLNELIPNHPKDGYSLLFDGETVEKLQSKGISFLQEAIDVFPQILTYIGLDREGTDFQSLEQAAAFFSKICYKVRRFSSSRFITDLIFGDVCVAQAWSGEALRAIDEAEKIGQNIKYIIPKEGGDLWIDVAAIPIGAPHPKNAHIFINFLLRPEIGAQITNQSRVTTMMKGSRKHIDPDIVSNTIIFPPDDVLRKLNFCSPPSKETDMYEKVRSRVWTLLKISQTPKEADKYKLVFESLNIADHK